MASIFQGLMDWTNQYLTPLGPLGLFLVAFIESSFFPIPPDIILIALVLIQPEQWIFLAAVCTAGSVIGALFGYFIGVKGGRPILHKLAGKRRTDKVENYYTKYGDWAIAIAAFTPVPYKIFTISSGVFKYSWIRMSLISIPARGARFFAFAGVVAVYGKEIVGFLDWFLGPVTLIALAIIIAAYIAYKKWIRKHK